MKLKVFCSILELQVLCIKASCNVIHTVVSGVRAEFSKICNFVCEALREIGLSCVCRSKNRRELDWALPFKGPCAPRSASQSGHNLRMFKELGGSKDYKNVGS